MPYTEAQKEATKKYLRTLKSMTLRVSHEDYERYQKEADKRNMSLRAFVLEAIEEKIKE